MTMKRSIIARPVAGLAALAAAFAFSAVLPTPAEAQPRHKVSYAFGSVSLSFLPVYLAEDLGYLKEEGIEYRTSVIKGGSGPAAAATISGNIDFFVGLLFSAARAIEQKQPLVGFATTLDQYGSTIVVSREVVEKHNLTEKTPIEERLDTLKGLRIASFGPNSSSDLLIRYIAQRKGWNPNTDMQLLPLGGAPALAAFEKKRIDAIVHSSPLADLAVSQHGGMMIVNLAAGEYKPLEGMPYITLVANSNWLAANKPAATAFVKALWRAMDYAHANPDATRDLLRKRFPQVPEETFNASFRASLLATPKTPAINADLAKIAIDFSNAVSKDKLTTPPAAMITDEIVKAAAAALNR